MRHVLAAVVAAAVFVLGGAAEAQNSPAAQRVLDRARTASGGAAGWNMLRGLHEVGDEAGVAFERWLDPLRYGLRHETATAAGGKLVQGYNGAAEWRILSSGAATGSDQGEHVAKVRSDAFFGAYGYFYPSRFDLRSSHLGVRPHGGRSFDVLRVQPAGGRPRELWFDRRTGLLGRIVEPGQGGPGVATEIDDYRKVGPVTAPFRFVTSGPGLDKPVVRTLKSLDFRPADRSHFSLPPPPPPPPKAQPAPTAPPTEAAKPARKRR
ncbi:hypothetical protein [Phenylobacterium sp.]|uniref:hypothetical protein n=1 Tax=Phenylobacterium sp. TaxID=1871053 RepID=UPI0035B48090